MCGRYTLDVSGDALARHVGLDSAPDVSRFNIAPSQEVPVVRVPSLNASKRISELQWGLVPFWADDTSFGHNLINARSETASEKPSFRDAFAKRRCVVPASGFYEWHEPEGDGPKQPYYIHPADEPIFGFAGLWERWTDDSTGERLESFTILTGEPNDRVADIHDRMPVVLSPDDYDFWMDPAIKDQSALQELVDRVHPVDRLDAHPVDTRVNNPDYDAPDCIEPMEG
jgi:putative SOS response-associated peptidase YedK